MADAVLWRSAVRSVKCIHAHGMRCIPAHEDLGLLLWRTPRVLWLLHCNTMIAACAAKMHTVCAAYRRMKTSGFSYGEHLEYYGYFIVTQCSYILKSERPPRPRGSFAAQKQKAEDATGTKMAFSNLNKNCRKC